MADLDSTLVRGQLRVTDTVNTEKIIVNGKEYVEQAWTFTLANGQTTTLYVLVKTA